MTDWPRRLILALSGALMLLVSSASLGWAQRLDSLPVGTRIKVIPHCMDCEDMIGTYGGWAGDSLVLRTGTRELALPRSLVSVVEISRGKNRQRAGWRGALQWGISGALLGALIGASSGGYGYVSASRRVHDVSLGIVLVGVPAAVIGGFVSAATAPELWRPIRLPPVP